MILLWRMLVLSERKRLGPSGAAKKRKARQRAANSRSRAQCRRLRLQRQASNAQAATNRSDAEIPFVRVNPLDDFLEDVSVFGDATEDQVSGICIVCRDFQDESSITSKRCGHTFHHSCIRDCVLKRGRVRNKLNSECPLCRQDLFPAPEPQTKELSQDREIGSMIRSMQIGEQLGEQHATERTRTSLEIENTLMQPARTSCLSSLWNALLGRRVR